MKIVAEDCTENMMKQKEDCLQEVAPSEEHTIALEELFKVIESIPEELGRGGASGLRAARDTWVVNMSIIGYEQSQFLWPIFTWKMENDSQLIQDIVF